MRTLYHYPLHPPSRLVRIVLAEKKLKVKEVIIDPWNPEPAFASLSAEAAPPVLIDLTKDGTLTVVGSRAISEYANEGSVRHPLLSDKPAERAEARRLCAWFDAQFANEVDAYILAEKVERITLGGGAPDTGVLREGRENLAQHLTYLTELLEQRDWLAGRVFSLGDIAAASHLSCLDFLGEIHWRDWPVISAWYQRMKSRPSMRPLLADRLPGFRAPRHYVDLDF